MKFRVVPFFIIVLSAMPGFAIDQVFLEPTQPISPALKAQGGASTANAQGFDALFVNPAAFADPQINLTFLSLEGTAQSSLTGLRKILEVRDAMGNPLANPFLSTLNDVVAHGGLGGEGSVRAGWVGANLGAGLTVQSRMAFSGPNLLDSKTLFDQTTMGVVGMGWPFDVGMGTLKLGADIRPMQRAYSTISFGTLKDNLANLSAYKIQSGFGLALDFGARWDYADFKTGLVIRDVGSTIIGFKEYSGTQWASGLSFPSGGSTAGSTLYRIPMVVGLGTNWTPDMGSLGPLFQPSLSFDLQIPIKDELTEPSFWTWTHLGAEAKFLQFLAVRAGMNQGYFTFGLGAKVYIFDFNLAVYTDEMGRYSGTLPRPAISMELAFRL